MRRPATLPERVWRCAGRRRTSGCSMRPVTRWRQTSGRPVMREFTVSRRGVLGGAALLAAPAIIRPTRAAEQCVVGTWGGDYARLLRENVDEPILKPADVEIVQDIGDESPRVSKLYAQRKLPRGSRGYRLSRCGERLPRERCGTGRGSDRGGGAEPEARGGRAAHAGLRAAHLQRAGAGVQPGQRHRSAANIRRPARSEVARQDRHGQWRGALGGDGGEPVRDRQDDRLRQRPRRSC